METMPGIGTSNRTKRTSGRFRTGLLSVQPRWRGRRVPLERGLAEAEVDVLMELERIRICLAEAMAPPETDGASLARAIGAAHADARRRRSIVESGVAALVSRGGPSASELRQAMALVAVMGVAERMMAQCVSIVTMRNLMGSGEEAPRSDLLDCLTRMSELADEQIVSAARVFAERDLAGLTELRNRDRKLCELNRRCLAVAGRDAAGNGTRNGSSLATLVARALERIGEGGLAIGRQAAFVAAGITPPALEMDALEA